MPTLITTVGGPLSNSYVTHAEANAYFESRVPFNPPWVTSGQEAALIMATRVLDALAQPWKTLFVVNGVAYYRIRRQWTGAKATTTQRLAWPRVGMFDQNGNPLDVAVSTVAVGSPAPVTTQQEHLLETGEKVLLFGVQSAVPTVNGEQTATVTADAEFTIPVNVTTAGVGGRVTFLPHQLKEATSELAAQLLAVDRTLDNDVILQGIRSIKAGSVAISFDNALIAQVIPDAVYNLLVQGWLTDELYEPALRAMFDVVST